MASVMDIDRGLLPTGLRHARDVAVVSELAHADTAQAELAIDRSRAPAAPTPGIAAGLVFGRPLLADDLRSLGHVLLSSELPPGRGRRSP